MNLEDAHRILRTCHRREPRFSHQQPEYVLTETEWRAVCAALERFQVPEHVITELPEPPGRQLSIPRPSPWKTERQS